MKRITISILLCSLVLSSNAQFKVQSDGKVAIHTTSTALSPISINGAGNAAYYIYCNNTGSKSGVYFSASASNSNTTLYGGQFISAAATQTIGLRGAASNGSTCIGVLGNGGTGTKSIGTLGTISQNYVNYGAAIYGSVYGDYGSALSAGDKYAGFFYGNIKVTGSIVAGTAIQGTLLGEASSEYSSSSTRQTLQQGSVLERLSGLNATSFQKKRPEVPEETTFIDEPNAEPIDMAEKSQADIINEQFYDRSHFALDANRLEEAFPDLVYVNKDGSKVINYMEMIPLLVQSINELSYEITELKHNAASRGTTSINDSFISQNRLYQNTPNPFKEQTVIRFKLADDIKDAAICIFDMTGKTIKKLPISSGMDSISVGGYELGEGMFLYSLIVNGQEIATKKMVISR